MIQPVDLGICRGYEYEGDPKRTALVLPGAMLAGMPVNAFAIDAVWNKGWRAVLVWDEFLDRSQDDVAWVRARFDAAAAYAARGERPGRDRQVALDARRRGCGGA